jgi:hypothetical protein
LNSESNRDSSLALTASRELTVLLEKFVQTPEKNKFSQIEKKLTELQSVIIRIKDNLA